MKFIYFLLIAFAIGLIVCTAINKKFKPLANNFRVIQFDEQAKEVSQYSILTGELIK